MSQLQLNVEGMACSLCAAQITDALSGMKGVRDVNVDLSQQQVLIAFEPREVMPAQLKDRLVALGFTVRGEREAAAPRHVAVGVAVALLALGALALWQSQWDMSPLKAWVEKHALLGAAFYLAAVVASVVLLPFSSLPFLPFATQLYGVWITALLSAAGWWIGSLIAFKIARLGRPYLERVTSLQAIDRLEHGVPKDVGFAGIVVLRMLFPVDVVSFALGLLKHIRFQVYAIASLIGIVPFAFVWSYAGGELGAGRFVSFAFATAGLAAAVLVLRRVWQRRQQALHKE